MKKKQILVFVILIILIPVLLFFAIQEKIDFPVSEGIAEQNMVTASNQSAGITVNIDSVELLDGGYLIIHKNQLDFPVEILGKSDYIEPGIYNNFPVSLLNKSKEGDKMFVVIHEDNGDKIFNPEYDFSVLNEENKIIMSDFTIE